MKRLIAPFHHAWMGTSRAVTRRDPGVRYPHYPPTRHLGARVLSKQLLNVHNREKEDGSKNAVFATSSRKRPSTYGPGGRLKTTGPGGRRGGGALTRYDDIREHADQTESMEMLGRRTARQAHTIFSRPKKLDMP